MAIVDTDVLIDAMKAENDAKDLLLKIVEKEPLYITQINEYELYKGAHLSEHKEHIEQVKKFLSGFQVFVLNIDSIAIAARTFSELSKKGELIDDFDILIASICIANNQKLVTRNIKHFSRIPGLKLHK